MDKQTGSGGYGGVGEAVEAEIGKENINSL